MFPLHTLIFILLTTPMWAQYHSDDLRSRWMEYSGGQYVPYNNADAIHFQLEENEKGDTLVISGKDFHVFVNNQLTGKGEGELKFSAEKLKQQFPNPMVTVFSPREAVQTRLLHPVVADEAEERVIPGQKRFVQIAFLILLLVFAVVLNVNRTYGTKILLDPGFYFAEVIPPGHIGSPLNIIYTLYAALVWGFLLSANQLKWPVPDFPHTVGGLLMYWMVLSAFLFLLVWLKIALMLFLAWVFNLSGNTGGVQSYQLSRLWLVWGLILSVCWVSYVILSGRVIFPLVFKYILVSVILLGYWLLFSVLVKLKISKSTLQLFSYFCASEILPFLIFIKALLF